jgi:hypothetical protein
LHRTRASRRWIPDFVSIEDKRSEKSPAIYHRRRRNIRKATF